MGPSGSLMSCRLGMLITMRRLALRSALIRLEAIFSIVSLLGVRNIKSNLRKIKITHNQFQKLVHIHYKLLLVFIFLYNSIKSTISTAMCSCSPFTIILTELRINHNLVYRWPDLIPIESKGLLSLIPTEDSKPGQEMRKLYLSSSDWVLKSSRAKASIFLFRRALRKE